MDTQEAKYLMTHFDKSMEYMKRLGFRSSGWLIVLVLILATGFRLWRINVDLPYIYRADEDLNLVITQNMLLNGDPNPHFFHYPSLMFYLNGVVHYLYFMLGKLAGQFTSLADIPSPIMAAMGSGKIDQPNIMLASRFLSALFGIGSVLLVYLSGRKLTNSVAVGIIAGIGLAVSPSHISSSQIIAPNAFIVFFVLLTFYFTADIFIEGKLHFYILAGISAGLAASSKYNGVFIIVAPITAHFFRYGWESFRRRELYICLGVAAFTFFATTPYSIMDYHQFIEEMTFEARHYASGHAGSDGNTIGWYISHLLSTQGPLLPLALTGLVWGIYRRSRKVLLIAVFPVLYFIFISRFAVRNTQTILPIIPFLTLLAAIILVRSTQYVSRRFESPRRTIIVGGLVAVGLAMIIIPSVKSTEYALNVGDFKKREPARIWIEQNLPGGSIIAVEPYSPFVNPDRYKVFRLDFSAIIHPLQWYLDENVDYVVMSSGAYERYFKDPDRYRDEIREYERLFEGFDLLRLFEYEDYTARIYMVKE